MTYPDHVVSTPSSAKTIAPGKAPGTNNFSFLNFGVGTLYSPRTVSVKGRASTPIPICVLSIRIWKVALRKAESASLLSILLPPDSRDDFSRLVRM